MIKSINDYESYTLLLQLQEYLCIENSDQNHFNFPKNTTLVLEVSCWDFIMEQSKVFISY